MNELHVLTCPFSICSMVVGHSAVGDERLHGRYPVLLQPTLWIADYPNDC